MYDLKQLNPRHYEPDGLRRAPLDLKCGSAPQSLNALRKCLTLQRHGDIMHRHRFVDRASHVTREIHEADCPPRPIAPDKRTDFDLGWGLHSGGPNMFAGMCAGYVRTPCGLHVHASRSLSR